MRRFDNTRTLQIVFFIVLAFTAAQVLWWILDQSRSSREVLDRTLSLYRADARAALELSERGASRESIGERFPHLAVEDGEIRVSDAAIAELERERRSRLNQYSWEGGFFLLVVIAGMVVLGKALREEAELRRRQQDFLAAVSHEFKSPLASLQLTAETMARRPSSAADRQRWIPRILSDVQRLEGMVSNILDSAQLEQGDIVLCREPLALRRAVSEAVAELAGRARELGVVIEQRIAPELEVHADPVAFHTVMRNLIENAIHATTANGGGTVTLDAEEDPGGVRLQVRDDGIGFDPQEAPKLFRRFYRVGDEIRRTSPGTGLGLAIVQRFLELEGGRVTADSAGPGRGATFTVTWPPQQGAGS
ncbi:MAG: HAMP domain-containing sensor histidine kinase [Thermoanaerobaculia bacterium]